ncbi:hypothetical protein AEM51_13090 [Bacteroidetes bacterium UKL13-3]|nr:hypothetical protein AEM51_13090 [Bacteroidetes bacterium UKL13-3]HCP93134.1 hypothetical protein [Bacteroidota bacterium]
MKQKQTEIKAKLEAMVNTDRDLKPAFEKLLPFCLNFNSMYWDYISIESKNINPSRRNEKQLESFKAFINHLNKSGKNYPSRMVFEINGIESEITDSYILQAITRAIKNSPEVGRQIEKQTDKELLKTGKPAKETVKLKEHFSFNVYSILQELTPYKSNKSKVYKAIQTIFEEVICVEAEAYSAEAIKAGIKNYNKKQTASK